MSEVNLRYLPTVGLPDPVERVPGLSMERRIQTDGQIKITSLLLRCYQYYADRLSLNWFKKLNYFNFNCLRMPSLTMEHRIQTNGQVKMM